MAKAFDATTKHLLEADPAAWLGYLGIRPDGPVEVVDSDLSTVTAEADKVFRVGGPEPYLVHVEVRSSADPTLPRRLLRYNALLDYRHDLRVWSVVVLLRPAADGPALTGHLGLRLPGGRSVHDFQFGVARAWQHSAEEILEGPLNLLPMALLADAPPVAARSIAERIDQRLRTEATKPVAVELMSSTLLLAGLRFEDRALAQIFEGVHMLNILDFIDPKVFVDTPGARLLMRLLEVHKSRSILMALGAAKFGPITPEDKARVEAIDDASRLDALVIRVLEVSSWEELLAPDPST